MNSTGTSPFQCKYACRYTIHNSAFLPEEASIVLLLREVQDQGGGVEGVCRFVLCFCTA